MMNVFCKTLLASALASVTLASAFAAEDPLTVYGKLNVTAQSNDEDGESTTTIQSNASRFGVQGGFELSNALQAFYTIEYEVDTGSASKDNFTARNQFVGLKGGFGSVSVGRNDTLLKISQGGVDQFNDLSADIKNLFKGENRLAQTATYLTPTIGDLVFGVTYAAQGDAEQKDEDGFSMAAMYGDAKMKNSPFFASIAYDSDVKQFDILRATIQAKFADLVLGAMYQDQEHMIEGGNQTGYLLSAAYSISEVTLKAQFQDMEEIGSSKAKGGDSWSIGADYALGKPTKVFAFFSNRSMEADSKDDNYLGVGLEHKF
jgi:predicted porin